MYICISVQYTGVLGIYFTTKYLPKEWEGPAGLAGVAVEEKGEQGQATVHNKALQGYELNHQYTYIGNGRGHWSGILAFMGSYICA